MYEYGVFPETMCCNRQDITEQLFLDAVYRGGTTFEIANLTLQSESATTRGYFELGSYRINQIYGSLPEKGPSL